MAGLLGDPNYAVTALDWSEAMLEIARAKSRVGGRATAFRQADAEVTMEPRRQPRHAAGAASGLDAR